MADQKISQLTTITTVDTTTDLFPIVDTSASETKKITPSALKTALSLNNVDNTSDANKPISTATQTALDAKASTTSLNAHINDTANPHAVTKTQVGLGNVDNTSDLNKPISTATQTALDAKVTANASITGATKTKLTYDAKGLVTGGADATTADIADSTNKRYVTDAQLTVIGNTSGTNTGDNAVNSLYSGLATSKQDTLVSGTNIKTINSTSLLGSGDIAISASPSGVSGAIQFSDGSAFSSDASNFFWNNTTKRLGIGTNAPSGQVHIKGSGSTSATTSLLVQNSAGTPSLQVTDDGNTTITNRLNLTASFDQIYAQSSSQIAIKGYHGVQILRTTAVTSTMFEIYDNASTSGGLLMNVKNAVFANMFAINYLGQTSLGTASPNASAQLQIDSTTRGFLPPRMTTTQKNAISSPASGLVVYDTTTNKLCCYNGTSWNDLF
jgi:hypothetical protein